MKKLTLYSIGLLVLVLIAIIIWYPSNRNISNNSSEIPNPASVNCINNGGHLKIMSGVNGEYGVCVFDDNSECEEWAFYRHTCKKGDSLNN